MNLGSTERTLTTKSAYLREVSQWTAATTLIAAGSLALFSATTLDRLSRSGDVQIDLSAFRKLGSTSLAFDRLEDERLIAEERGLLSQMEMAHSKPLPKTRTAFQRIRIAKKVEKKAENHLFSDSSARALAGSPITLKNSDAEEIAMLERAPDPAHESRALAQIYRNLKVRFVAAVQRVEQNDSGFPEESIAIARMESPREYDEIPSLDAEDLVLPVIETAPAAQVAVVEELPSVTAEPLEPVKEDSIAVSLSSVQKTEGDLPLAGLTVARTNEAPQVEKVSLPAISSPGLDLVPGSIETNLTTQSQVETRLSSHESEVKQATGPPEELKTPENEPDSTSQLNGVTSLDPNSEKLAETQVEVAPETASDFSEYSKDVASIYSGESDHDGDSSEALAEYPSGSANVVTNQTKAPPRKTGETLSTTPSGMQVARNTTKDYGHGVHRDDRGITIDWSEAEPESTAVFVGRPGDPETSPVGAKIIHLSQSSAKTNEPEIDTKKCETARVGVEALNSGAEKESLSICRRELSFEGLKDGSQSRWWESYENQGEHWPTLTYAKPNEISSANRIPLLSTASIRILSAISKANTHTGTGIIFGEAKKGVEVQLLGRSDAPIFLDSGMKLRDPSAEIDGARPFVFLNVEPGQPLLMVKGHGKKSAAALPLVVKSGMATYIKVGEPREVDLNFTLLDASSAKEKRLENLTALVIGQPGKMAITDRSGNLKIPNVATYGDFPIYVDVLKSEKSYKNRFRVRTANLGREPRALYFFDEKRVDQWLSQLAGGLSPYSGLIAGVVPKALRNNGKSMFFKIGILEKKGSLVPERYLLDDRERLVSEPEFKKNLSRYVGVQIPEGPAIPTIVDAQGVPLWSEFVYSQPGVINVVSPEF